ncbi:MAG: ABC transporter permease [Ilumatobacteraceae bacterium]
MLTATTSATAPRRRIGSAPAWTEISRVLRRLGLSVVSLLLATVVVFAVLQIIPGDPATAILGEYATPDQVTELRAQLGLDKPLLNQYFHWLGNVLHGDLGKSLYSGEKVTTILGQRLPATLQIVALAVALSLLIGVPMGIAAARRNGRAADRVLVGMSTLGVAVPSFWLAMMLATYFGLTLGWFPATGFAGITEGPWQFLQHALLPALALSLSGAAEVSRQLRGSLVESLHSDYVRTARSKGLRARAILYRHALPNAGVTVLTVIGLITSRLLGATVVVEAVFAIPGLGSLVVDAVQRRDYPLIQGALLVFALWVIAINTIVDFLYPKVDPRIQL